MSGNVQTILDFIGYWHAKDLDRIIDAMTEDCFYHNIPWQPLTGHAAIRESLKAFIDNASEVEWIVIQIAENERGAVLTERIDRFLIGGKWLEIPVMGTFELRDGKIAKWRDYFDSAQVAAAKAEE